MNNADFARRDSLIRIAPSLLSADMARLGDEVQAVERAGADLIHLDVMDGHFVPNLTFGPGTVKALRECTQLPLDVHLMVEEPLEMISAFAGAGADIISVHAESCRHLHRVISEIKSFGIKVGVALNPATPLCSLEYLLEEIDMLLIMGVNPGFGGQTFIPSTLTKIRNAKGILGKCCIGRNIDIEVDGGVNQTNAREITDAGASILVAGSALFTENRELSIESRINRLKGF